MMGPNPELSSGFTSLKNFEVRTEIHEAEIFKAIESFKVFFPVKSITGFFRLFFAIREKNEAQINSKLLQKRVKKKKHWEVRFDAAAWRANRKLLSRLKTCHNHLLDAI